MKSIIFDIDGTLADLTHRLHYISNGGRNWDAFFAAADKDTPIRQVIELVNILRHRVWQNEYRIILVSGRNARIRTLTETWLEEHGVEYDLLYMRREEDTRKDNVVKKEILAQIRQETNNDEILFVVDDRPSVVRMWREEGLVCLQCSEWKDHKAIEMPRGLWSLMVGPCGAGKSSWLQSAEARQDYGIDPSHVVSSDQIRQDICGDFKDQSRNTVVFSALFAVVQARINNGLSAVVDATNIKRADRMRCAEIAQGGPVRYFVLDRPMSEKVKDGGWRNTVGFDLLGKHQGTFNSQLKDILKGDMLPNVTIIDLKKP